MDEVQEEIVTPFKYKEKYCNEDSINYKYYRSNDNDNHQSNRYCYQWDDINKCFIENTLIFSDFRSYSLNDLSQALGCISCCKDCTNNVYINDLQSLKSKSISNISQNNDDFLIITFRNRKNSTDYPLIYHSRTQSLNYCSLYQPSSSPCSVTYTCFPVTSRTITSDEIDNDVPDFANIIFILLFIVVVVSVIALIWIVIYVIRTYRRHKKKNQIADENYREDDEEVYDSQDDKEYLSDNYDYVYRPSSGEETQKKFVKLKTDS